MSRRAVRERADHVTAAATLRTIPGKWLRVYVYRSASSAKAAARKVREGELRAYLLPGDFEARTEPLADGDTALLVRYVGVGEEL